MGEVHDHSKPRIHHYSVSTRRYSSTVAVSQHQSSRQGMCTHQFTSQLLIVVIASRKLHMYE